MSDVRPKTEPFLELYRKGKVTARQIGEFIEAWHGSDDIVPCPLAEYLGMTEDEYTVVDGVAQSTTRDHRRAPTGAVVGGPGV